MPADARLSGAFRAALGKPGGAAHPAGMDHKPTKAARLLKPGEEKALKGGKAPPARLAPRQGHR